MSLITGRSPTEIEQTWETEDVHWTLGVARAREMARLQLAKQHKVSVNDIVLPFSVFVKFDENDTRRKRGN